MVDPTGLARGRQDCLGAGTAGRTARAAHSPGKIFIGHGGSMAAHRAGTCACPGRDGAAGIGCSAASAKSAARQWHDQHQGQGDQQHDANRPFAGGGGQAMMRRRGVPVCPYRIHSSAGGGMIGASSSQTRGKTMTISSGLGSGRRRSLWRGRVFRTSASAGCGGRPARRSGCGGRPPIRGGG